MKDETDLCDLSLCWGSGKWLCHWSAKGDFTGTVPVSRARHGDVLMMTLGSLFDGIGGFPLAAVHYGVTPLWASEIEAFPIEVTKIRFPDMVHVGDITKLNGAELPPVDVICGGSPCQDYAEKIVIPRIAMIAL